MLLQNNQMLVRCRVEGVGALLLQNDQMCGQDKKKVNRRERHTLLQRMTEKRYKNVSSIVQYNSELLHNSIRRELS